MCVCVFDSLVPPDLVFDFMLVGQFLLERPMLVLQTGPRPLVAPDTLQQQPTNYHLTWDRASAKWAVAIFFKQLKF